MSELEVYGGDENDFYKEFNSIGEFILHHLTSGRDRVVLVSSLRIFWDKKVEQKKILG